MATGLWEFWIDRGGTFTDVIGRSPEGQLKTAKLLSDNSDHYSDAAVEGVRRLMGAPKDEPIPGHLIGSVKIGTTVATNALLERTGARVAFVTTQGFADAPDIGDQTRPDIFALNIQRPAALYTLAVEVEERMDVWGGVLTPLNTMDVRRALLNARAKGCDAAAICLLHACANPKHENEVAAIARDVGFRHVSVSSEIDPLVKFVPRARTTLADAYLTAKVRAYADSIREQLGGAPVYFMTSNGGLTTGEVFRGKDALLSGPAGGVVGMARTAQAAGFPKILGFDMGGTSTDVSRFDGEDFERVSEAEIGGWRVRAPMLAVHTVAAGGGSILHADGARAQVGPQSAGADPGPAAYGRGGPLTVTDANLILGRLHARFFPLVFGPQANQPLFVDQTRERFAQLAQDMGADSIETAAEGFLTVAVENTAQAVKHMSVEQGYNATGYALASFGGAGGQIACRVAEALGIRTVLVHPMASVMSALGMGLADLRVWREAAFDGVVDDAGASAANERAQALEEEARSALFSQDVAPDAITTRTEARLRYAGSDTTLATALGPASEMIAAFEAAHRRMFGFIEPGVQVQLESLAVQAKAPSPGEHSPDLRVERKQGGPVPFDLTKIYENGEFTPAPIYRLQDIAAGNIIHGPTLVVEPNSQIVVERGWRGVQREDGMLVLERFDLHTDEELETVTTDPVRLELFNKRFMAVAEQMGAALERTAKSVNIKERLDFSCAVFDAEGGLVANAPHMPVHLGSMGESVRAVIAKFPDMGEGDAAVLNTPYEGGTHLPDITVVKPVNDPETGERMFFVAARGHHADIGGIQPGSMPPFSTTIEEEGVAIAPMTLVEDGVFAEKPIRDVLTSAAYPARAPDRNIADLKAQVAACVRGADALKQMAADHGRDVVQAYMGHVQNNAEAAVRRIISIMPDGEAEMAIDGGLVIKVRVSVNRDDRSAIIDFDGTSAQDDKTNFNAPTSVTRAAVLYVFRTLVGQDIPLNDGCLTPIDIRIPEGCLLNPKPPAAVVAGNVETSQHVVDALFAATGALSASQGTMNNLTFGDARRQYYETIAGGAGAGPSALGASAVQTHMTNSRMTDPEILESRFPVLVESHELRDGSGGQGRRAGGDGAVRRLRFLDRMSVSLLSTRREAGPPGLKGGAPGQPGEQWLIRANGEREQLEGRFRIDVSPGDIVEVRTPGAGGWG